MNWFRFTSINSLLFLVILSFTSCKSFTQNLLFKTEESINPEVFKSKMLSAQLNYTIQKQDYLAISVFPNKGEQIITQTNDFPMGDDGVMRNSTNNVGAGNRQNGTSINFPIMQNNASPNSYLVDGSGQVNLPKIGKVNLVGLTLAQADSLLEEKFKEYVKEPYVVTQYLNKRVVLMGAFGERVIPLNNENVSLYEVLAGANGQSTGGGGISLQRQVKTSKVKIIRGYYTDTPSILIVDLSTFEGMADLNVSIQPNDIVYVEPRRRIDREAIGDIGAILSPITSIIAVYLSIRVLSQ